ncbi:MAG: hypothetical protein QXX17_05920 [Conexivisphaerales archaeon]
MERLNLDPLGKVKEAVKAGKISQEIGNKVSERLPLLQEMVREVEETSGVSYPPYYIMPLLILVKSEVETGVYGVYYARNVPAVIDQRLNLLVEFTAPLLIYASKDTLLSVVAHEFTHYLELIRRFTESPFSSPSPSTMFEATYKDMQEAMDPEYIFGRRSRLVTAIKKKFSDGFTDEPLNKRVIKHWLESKLPYVVVRPDDNAVRIPVSSITNPNFDSKAVEKAHLASSR